MRLIREKLRNLYQGMQHLSGGRLEILSESVSRFIAMNGPETAATLAYYALFSLFPLILFLVAVLTYLMESSEEAYIQIIVFFGSALPVSFTEVQDNLREFLNLRGQIGAIGIIGALWSASSYFTTLARSINRAWPGLRLRNVVQSRLVGLAMVGALFLLLLFSLLSSAFVNLIPSLVRTMGVDVRYLSPLWQLLLRFVPSIFSFLMFVGLYRWVPNRLVCWRAVFIGSAVTAFAWESAKFIFGVFISSGLFNYELLYGSLGTMIVLMFWIYLSSMIALFGAYVVATVDMRLQPEATAEVKVKTTPDPHPAKDVLLEDREPPHTPAWNKAQEGRNGGEQPDKAVREDISEKGRV